ncbi:endodeoxyribonuclease [Martelella mangrovi]|uniref:Endonuclease I n=1 Tax=Martelella mangrovi TaxID=1397477 RepID=A0ABV2IFK5_9HYPH
MRRKKKTTSNPGLKYGFRSGLEDKVAAELHEQGIPIRYEDPDEVINYTKPVSYHKYHPDFVLPNGIIVETKGRFETADRKKHRLIREQHPDKDIRFVFSNSRQRISKTSQTTYAAWCEKYGFKFADKSVPAAWLIEATRSKTK